MRPDGVDRRIDPTGLAFSHGSTNVGNLTYANNADGLISSEAGSLASANLPAPVSGNSYNAANQLVSSGGTAYTYNADGDLTANGTDTFTWSALGQLTGIAGATTASFSYDPFGRQSASTVNGTSTSYLYDGGNIVEELSGSTPTLKLLTTALKAQPITPAPINIPSGPAGQILQLTSPSGTNSSVLTSPLGSSLALASATAQITTSYTYDPAGAVTASGASSPNTFEFNQTQNLGTGLYLMGARAYNAASGTFTSPDPTGLASGTDLYQYTQDDPVNLTDPSGCNPHEHCIAEWSENGYVTDLLFGVAIGLAITALVLSFPALVVLLGGEALTLGLGAGLTLGIASIFGTVGQAHYQVIATAPGVCPE